MIDKAFMDVRHIMQRSVSMAVKQAEQKDHTRIRRLYEEGGGEQT